MLVDIATALEMNLLRFVGFKMLTHIHTYSSVTSVCVYVCLCVVSVYADLRKRCFQMTLNGTRTPELQGTNVMEWR